MSVDRDDKTILRTGYRGSRVKPEDAPVALAIVLRRSGDWSEAPEPDPISNSAVKRLSADGTVSQDTGE